MIPKIDRPTGQHNFQVVWTESGAGYAFSYDVLIAFRTAFSSGWVISAPPLDEETGERKWSQTTLKHISHIRGQFHLLSEQQVKREDFEFQVENVTRHYSRV